MSAVARFESITHGVADAGGGATMHPRLCWFSGEPDPSEREWNLLKSNPTPRARPTKCCQTVQRIFTIPILAPDPSPPISVPNFGAQKMERDPQVVNWLKEEPPRTWDRCIRGAFSIRTPWPEQKASLTISSWTTFLRTNRRKEPWPSAQQRPEHRI